MRLPIVRKTLRDVRWQVVGYGVGLFAYAALLVLIYPAFQESLQDFEVPAAYEEIFGVSDFASPRGYLSTEVFAFAPVVVAVYAVVAGTGALGGEESAGTLELLLSQPLSRRSLFLQKVAGLFIGAVVIVAATALGFLLTVPAVDFGSLGAFEVAAAALTFLGPVLFFLAAGLLIAAVAPSRGQAAGVLSVIVIVAYIGQSFAQISPATEWLRYVSPFYYADSQEVLLDGVTWWHQALLAVTTLLLLVLGLRAFAGREVDAGRWQPRALLAGDPSRSTARPYEHSAGTPA